MDYNSREDIRRIFEDALQKTHRLKALEEEYNVLQYELNVAHQQKLVAAVDLLKTEGLAILNDEQYFQYIIMSLMHWVHQKGLSDLRRAHITFGGEAEDILQNADLDLTASIDVERALNEVLAQIGLRIALFHIDMIKFNAQEVHLVILLTIQDMDVFLANASKYEPMLISFSNWARYANEGGEKQNETFKLATSFVMAESHNLAKGVFPLIRATQPESPFDAMPNDLVWTVYRDMEGMMKEEPVEQHVSLKAAIHDMHRLSA